MIGIAVLILALGVSEAEVQDDTTTERSKLVSELLQEATVAVGKIIEPDKRAGALLRLASTQARAGGLAAARKLVQEAIRTAQALDASIEAKDLLLADAAATQAGFGDLSDALKTVQFLAEGRRNFSRNEIIEALSAKGEHKKAIEVCRTIEQRDLRGSILCTIAASMAEKGELEQASLMVREIENAQERSLALLLMTLARLEARDFESAKRLAATIEKPMLKLRWLYEFGMAQLRANQSDAARQTYLDARQLEKAAKLSNPVFLISLQARIGELREALAAAEALDDPLERDRTMKDIALWLADNRQTTEAIRLLAKIENEFEQAETRMKLAIRQAKNGEIDEGLRTAKTVLMPSFRSQAFREIARHQFAKDDRNGAKASLVEALKSANELMPGGGTDIIVLREVAAAQAQTADLDAARQTFQQALKKTEAYPDLSYQAELIRQIAEAESLNGLSQDAKVWALKLPSPEIRFGALIGVVDAQLALLASTKK